MESGEQTIVLLNRRGFSSFVACRVLRRARAVHQLFAHPDVSQARPAPACAITADTPKGAETSAPSARASISTFWGSGSERVEEELHRAFPAARIARLDRDTVTGKRQYETILHGFPRGQLRHAGGHADDRQGPRYSERDAGGRGVGRLSGWACRISARRSAPSNC